MNLEYTIMEKLKQVEQSSLSDDKQGKPCPLQYVI